MRSLFFAFILFSLSISEIRSQSAPAEVTSHITSIKNINGKLVRELSVLIKIYNKQGEGYADISVPYKLKELKSLNAELLDRNQETISKLKNKVRPL